MEILKESLTLSSSFLALIAALSIGLGTCFLYFKNPILLKHMLWVRFLKKEVEFNDAYLDAAVREQKDVYLAKEFLPSFSVQNIYQLKAVLAWCVTMRIGINELRGMSQFIHYDGDDVRLDTHRYRVKKGIYCIFLTFAFSAFTIITALTLSCWLSESILLSGKDSGKLLLLNKSRAVVIEFNKVEHQGRLVDTSMECVKKSNRTALSDREFVAACELIRSGEAKIHLENSYLGNLLLLILIDVFLLWVLIEMIKGLAKYINLGVLQSKLKQQVERLACSGADQLKEDQ